MLANRELNGSDTLIIGYPGRLAWAFSYQWPLAQRVGKKDFDITNRSATLEAIQELRPNLVVNCAGLTDMSLCEEDPDLAWAVNVRGVRNLAEACQDNGALLVHFSSDYALEPVNEYGWTKRASESLSPLTIRGKIYDGSHWAWTALLRGQSINMLTTEFLNPISTTGAAALTEGIILRGLKGLINIGTGERLNFWQVGLIWAGILGADPSLVKPISSLESELPRKADMFLETNSLANSGISVPKLEDDALQHKSIFFVPKDDSNPKKSRPTELTS